MRMFKNMFNSKRKHQEQGKPKITLDQASQHILSRHFSPLPSRAKSPSDVLDIVGYPLIDTVPITTTTTRTKSVSFKNNVKTYKPYFSQSSPDLTTPYQLTIRNNISPSPPLINNNELDNDQALLLEANREEKTLVEKELLESKNLEVYRLHQKLLELEQERELMNQKFQDFMEREERMRSIIQESQFQINQLKYYAIPSRRNSYKTTSTRSSWFSDEEQEDQCPYRTKSSHDLYYYYHKGRPYYSYYPQQYYYYH